MDEIGGGGVASVGRATSTTERRPASPSDAVIKLPTPDRAGTTDISNSRPPSFSTEYDPTKHKIHSQSPDNSQSRSSQSLHPSESQSSTSSIAQHQHFIPPPSSQPLLPPISPSSAYQPPPPQWAQTKSPTSAPSNPFYSHAYRSATPPLTSSAEQSPLVSPAKRFSSGEVKPLPFSPTSPRQPLSEEDRQRFNQLAAQLKTRLTYAALKVENGWEKHSLSQIQTLLNEEHKTPSSQSSIRRRSHTISDALHLDSPFERPPSLPSTHQHHSQPSQTQNKLTYESFWASHSQQRQPHTRHSSQPLFHATFPRRKPERLSLTSVATPSTPSPRSAHTARDQSAAEIMIALASPRTRSEFSSPERDLTRDNAETDEDHDATRSSPTPRKARKRAEVMRDGDGLGIRTLD